MRVNANLATLLLTTICAQLLTSEIGATEQRKAHSLSPSPPTGYHVLGQGVSTPIQRCGFCPKITEAPTRTLLLTNSRDDDLVRSCALICGRKGRRAISRPSLRQVTRFGSLWFWSSLRLKITRLPASRIPTSGHQPFPRCLLTPSLARSLSLSFLRGCRFPTFPTCPTSLEEGRKRWRARAAVRWPLGLAKLLPRRFPICTTK